MRVDQALKTKVRQGKHADGLRVLLVLAACLAGSCTSPQAVATFADNAQKALGQGPELFRDLQASCVRRHQDAQPIVAVYLPPAASAPGQADVPAVCHAFGPQGDALIQASGVLTAYIKAIQQLAAFNTSSVSSQSESAAENAATAAQLNTVQIDSIGKLTGFVAQAFTAHYQRRHLVEYLRQADSSVSSVTQGFQDIVGKDYESLLAEERRALGFRYQQAGDVSDRATILLLNRAYIADLQELDRRKAAADAYVQALGLIREGHHQLALNAGHLGSKQLSLAVASYDTKLQALLPQLQKGL